MHSNSNPTIFGSFPRLAILLTLTTSILTLAVAPAPAYYGDCGQPQSDGNTVHVSDALYLLYTAVGNTSYPAPLCVGDVNSDASITAADALMVQNKAVGQSVTLACPTGSTCTDCNETAISNRLAALVDDERVLANTSTIFRCNQNQTITVGSTWSATVAADNVIVSARDRKLAIKRHSSCPGSQPSTGIRFLTISGDDVVLGTPEPVSVPTPPSATSPWTDLAIERFWNNVEVTGDNVTIRGVSLDFPCNAGLINKTGAFGTELRASIVSRTEKRGIRVESNSINTTSPCTDAAALYASSPDRHCYNLAVYDTLFTGAYSPFRISQAGRYLLKDSVAKTQSGWPCTDPLLENAGIDFRVRFDAFETEDCDTGILAFGDALLAVDNSYIHDSDKRGLWIGEDARASLRSNDIMDNGGSASSDPHYGGVAMTDFAYVDMGIVGDPGNNTLCGNRDPSGFLQIDQDGGTLDNFGNSVTNSSCP